MTGATVVEDPMKRSEAVTTSALPAGDEGFAPSLVQRPDGWYWVAQDGRREGGPFTSAAEAQADLAGSETALEPGAVLREVEDEIGVADWIDPDTRSPAEHGVPHIEEH
jgi:hypothetical protein